MTIDVEGHRQVRELLPWFLVDALEPAEAALVAAHLDCCADCRAELQAEIELREAVCSAATPRLAPHASSFARLVRRIEAAERRRLGPRARRLGSAVRDWAARWITPRRLRIGALVVAHNVVLVLVVAGIVRTLDRAPADAAPGDPRPRFETPRFETRSTEAPLGTRRLRVVFRDDVAMWEIVDLLREQRLELVAGPSQVGVFQVQARAGVELGEVVEILRRDPRVRLVAGWP
jgi:hypothetical protein